MPVSLSARRAWIEIFISREMSLIRPVALRKESVDRNIQDDNISVWARVALRKESVDRNIDTGGNDNGNAKVALRKESVDRNSLMTNVVACSSGVALRKESVDRNTDPVLNA